MTNNKRSILFRFVLFYVAGIALVVILISAYTSKLPAADTKDNYAALFISNEALNKDLAKLYALNEQYLTTLSFPLVAATRDSIIKAQTKLIEPIQQSITRVVEEGNKYDTITKKRYHTTAAYHDNAIKNWQTVNTFILFESGSSEAVPVVATDTRNDQLREKEAAIASLQKKLAAAQRKVNPNTATLQKNADEIKFLKWALRSQVATNKSLENRLKTNRQ